ncbi:MAG: radical SAM protein [Desulfocapsaceae bacterium]|nr:radical SAM protein [Desulfocapsaceae bacterium]
MHYEGNIFRPPSEANSILLQVTRGCSHNKCSFCGMYKGTRFSIKDDATILADIEFAVRHCQRQTRLFLCDGDVLIVPQKRLLTILAAIRERLPWVSRVATYANTKSILRKTPEELRQLRDLGLSMAYMGLESGDDVTLQRISKGADAQRMIDMGWKIRAAGIKLSITVLLGIAGCERSEIHARETGRVLSAVDPEYVGALSLMLTPGTPLYDDSAAGRFSLPAAAGMLRELRTMFACTNLTDGFFHANHASNYLPIKARLPQDKAAVLRLIDSALKGETALRPEYMRAL